MKKVVAASANGVNKQRLESLKKAITNVLDILDSMDASTYSEVESILGKDYYSKQVEDLQDLSTELLR